MKKFGYVEATIIIASVFASCAALGKIIEPGPWLALLNLAAAGVISTFIFKGSAKG